MKLLRKIRFVKSANHFKGYAIHSPFIFGIVSSLIYSKYPFYSFGNMRQFYAHLSKTEKKTALSLKDAFRLYRLFNALNPIKIKCVNPDKLDSFMLNSFNAKPSAPYTKQQFSLLYVAEQNVEGWHNTLKNMKYSAKNVFVIKHPNTQNRAVWQKLLNVKYITASITLYGLGIAFTDTNLPRKNFRIVNL